MDWLAFITNIINRVPVERLLVPPPDHTKALEDFVKSISRTESQKEASSEENVMSTTSPSGELAKTGATGVVTRQGLDPETMQWQLEETRGELWELERHLKHHCQDCGADNSCCFKHAQNLIDIARETKSMTTGPIWDQIITLAEEIKVKAHPDNIRSETYFSEFPQLVIRVSELRKPIETELIELSKPELSLEEAKKQAAVEAARRVEETWGKEEKS